MNTFKLTVKKVDYIVNENKVICNVEFTFRSFPFIVAAVGDHKATTIMKSNAIPNESAVCRRGQSLSIYAKGIATCSPNDKFDETLGKRIAYSKAVIEGYKKYYQILNTATEALRIKLINMADNRDRVNDISVREMNHLDILKNAEKYL